MAKLLESVIEHRQSIRWSAKRYADNEESFVETLWNWLWKCYANSLVEVSGSRGIASYSSSRCFGPLPSEGSFLLCDSQKATWHSTHGCPPFPQFTSR